MSGSATPNNSKQALQNPGVRVSDQIGEGIVRSVLGQGGAAVVYEIWNPHLETARAVKLLRPNQPPLIRQQFETESKITVNLHHPNIVEIHYVGEWHGLPYIVMEKIEGTSLAALRKVGKPLPIELCIAIGVMVCRALKYAHNQEYILYGQKRKGIVHCDLSPANIMISNTGNVKLTDFGLAKPVSQSVTGQTDSIPGTLRYIAPEVLKDGVSTVAADIYSLGVILYEAVCGCHAYPSLDLDTVVRTKVRDAYISLSQHKVAVPNIIRGLIERCMSSSLTQRPATADECLVVLEDCLRKFTKHSPEEVCRRYLAMEDGTGRSLDAYRRIPRSVYWIGATAVATTILTFLVIGIAGPKNNAAVQHTQEIAPVPLSQTAIPTTAQPLAVPAQQTEQDDESTEISPTIEPDEKHAEKKGRPAANERQLSDNQAEDLPTKDESPLKKIKARYATTDLLEIAAEELAQGKYASTLLVLDSVAPAQANSVRANILKLRALQGAGDEAALAAFLVRMNVADGEFYLRQAQHYYKTHNIDAAVKKINLASQTSSIMMTSSERMKETLFYKALCSSALFDTAPTAQNGQTAMDDWFNAKYQYRDAPGSVPFQKAEKEIRRISETIQK